MTDPKSTTPTARLTSIDAYRGLVMFLMMAEVLRLHAVSEAVRGSEFWRFLAHHQTHAEWTGCSLHDLIQPSFSFLVGVSLPFSIASREARGQSRLGMTLHAVWRGLVLALLGVFLRSLHSDQTYWTFEDTLTQIGLGYPLLFLIGLGPPRLRWISLGIILVGYWLFFALFPYDGNLSGHLANLSTHWNKGTNAAEVFDQWFLNLFPRKERFTANSGGYATASFYPTLGTMILGLIAGSLLRSDRAPREKIRWLIVAGVAGLVAGYALGLLGVCPVVKRIWTPSWVLFSGGWCFLFLAAFYGIIDVGRSRWWAFPLVVIGANSIAAYLIAHPVVGFVRDALKRHLPTETFRVFGREYEPLLLGAAILLVEWLILFWMYRRKLFLRI